MRFQNSLAFVCLAVATASQSFVSPSNAADVAFAPDSLRSMVTWLADDARQGRGAGTKGLQDAGDYLAARFTAAGLRPAGDSGTFFQNFDATIGVQPEGRNRLRLAGREVAFKTEWMPYGFSETGTITAPLVFAGYGIKAPEYDYDDYAGLDVKGKIVVVLRHEPGKNDSTSVFAGKLDTPHAHPRHKAILAREMGAVGMLTVTGSAGDEPDVLAKLRPDATYSSAGIACGQVTRDALAAAVPELDLKSLQAQIDRTGKPASRPLQKATVEWSVGLKKERTPLRNVAALLPGRDAGRVLVIGAHYDHLGMGGEGSLAPDSQAPHNGADDNASGTAALVAIARHFAAGPKPPVSLLFLAFSGEEIGLVGSSYYVNHPLIPLDSTLAMLNMDMVGRLRDRKLQVFGTSTAKEWEHLLKILNDQGPRFELTMKGDGYGPSDQMSFFQKGLPVLHFFTGSHAEYHTPQDDAALCNFEGMAEVAAYVAAIAENTWDTKLTFVAAAGPAPGAGDTGGGGFRSRLGAIPDYGQAETIKGVLLTGVRAGSPAEKAGIHGGDIIVQMGSTVVSNLQDMMYALNTHKPGDAIDVIVMRDQQRVTLPAVLGSAQP